MPCKKVRRGRRISYYKASESRLSNIEDMEAKEKQIERAESRLVVLRGKQVIIDRDVAELYGFAKRVSL